MTTETYKLNGNTLIQQPEMKEPPHYMESYTGIERTTYLRIKAKYKEHIASLKSYEISGNIPPHWEEEGYIIKGSEFELKEEEIYEPYFGWCDVKGCENEGANGGGCWRETGYWTVCSKHSSAFRRGEPRPEMKQSAIDREKTRGADGILSGAIATPSKTVAIPIIKEGNDNRDEQDELWNEIIDELDGEISRLAYTGSAFVARKFVKSLSKKFKIERK